MTLQQLKYFIKVCECNSISKAASELFISQPSLSSAIKEIENEFKIILFNRRPNGVSLSTEGSVFLTYARSVIEQSDLLEGHYLNKIPSKKIWQISSQHYSFVVTAFTNILKSIDSEEYDFVLRETKTYEIIEDVSQFRSEIGIMFLSEFNEKVIKNILSELELDYEIIYETLPYVFISNTNPLANKKMISFSDLEKYPCLTFEQGIHNSFFYSEEILSNIKHKKSIKVSDRATLFNLLLGINGYTICSGVIDGILNGDNIISIPLNTKEKIKIIIIRNKKAQLSSFTSNYIFELKRILKELENDY